MSIEREIFGEGHTELLRRVRERNLGPERMEALISWLNFDRPPGDEDRVDDIFVFGAHEGSSDFTMRVDLAIQMAERYPEAKVITSGGVRGGRVSTEAQELAQALISRGIASDRVIMETGSTHTQENVANSISAIPEGHSFLVVTSGYHGRRVDLTIQKYFETHHPRSYFIVDADVRGVPVPSNNTVEGRKRFYMNLEMPRIIEYRQRGII